MDGLRAPDRELAESELSQALRAALADENCMAEIADDELGASVLGALASAWVRAEMSRRFHNDAVSHTRRIRRKLLVRVLRSEEHTSELQSRGQLVCRLLLEKDR